MPSAVISLRISQEQAKRLQRKARQLGRSPSETGAMLLDESLRRDEFAFIDFRNSPVGRQAYLQGSSLAVWEVVWLARGYRSDPGKTAAHLEMPPSKVKAALNYAKEFPAEIETAIQEHESSTFESLSRTVPQAEVFPPPTRKKR